MQIPSTEDITPQDKTPPTEQALVSQETVSEKNNDEKKDSKDNDKNKNGKLNAVQLIKDTRKLTDKVKQDGKVRVIVELNTDYDPNFSEEKKVKQKKGGSDK